jgi:F-type H+-transporting ATPase subunit b
MNAITQFAAASTGSTNIFTAIGLDWKMLIFQVIGFLILVWLMSKYVYPPLIKTIDERQAKIEASNKAATTAEKKAAEAKADIEKLLKQARTDATDILATAKEEANATVEAAHAKAKVRADRIVAEANEQLQKDIVTARKALRNETLELVSLATEKVVGKTVTADVDEKMIAAAVEEAK